MAQPYKQRSIYRRTTLAAFASVMVAFTILSLVYYGVMNERVYRLQCDHMYTVAMALRSDIEAQTSGHESSQVELSEKIDLLSESTRAYIWLVRTDGLILHASQIPDPIAKLCRRLTGGLMQMPLSLVGSRHLSDNGILLRNSELARLIAEDGVDWISVYLPIRNGLGNQTAVLQLHLPYVDQYNWRWFITNGVGVAFLVALIISIALTLILMNYLTMPLEALAKAAGRVTLGDYSVRVRYSDIEQIQSAEDLEGVDEITRLMVTFNAMVARLESVNAEQRDMISCISHDMKTPLTSIIGFSDALIDGTIPAERQAKYLDIIRQEALRLKNLLTDMNQETQIENQGTQNFQDFDIQDVFVRTINSLENQLGAKALSVEVQFAAGKEERLYVTGDEEQISRVVYNLISNATKFCRPHDTLRVTTEYDPGSLFVRCSVEDSGPGIPEDKRTQIFGRFYKLDKSRGNREGSGLGLYICRKILANHGQQIYATKSQDLGGARFVFTLPAAKRQKERKVEKPKGLKALVWKFGEEKAERDAERASKAERAAKPERTDKADKPDVGE